MFENILVPLDGSHSCLRARQLAAKISKQFGSNITAMHVISHDFMHPELKASYNLSPLIIEELDKTYQKTGRKILTEAEEFFNEAGIKITTILERSTNPSERILEKATELKTDLIIMGNIAGEKSHRFSLGSVAEKVSHHAACSVLIVKRNTDIEKLLVAFDNSEDSLKALKVAVELCKKFPNAKMTVLNVENRELHRLEPDVAQKIGERILTLASTHIEGVVCDTRIEYGKPEDIILKIAKIDNYDIILLGSRGLSRIRRFFMGSVGTYVSMNSERSVFLVR